MAPITIKASMRRPDKSLKTSSPYCAFKSILESSIRYPAARAACSTPSAFCQKCGLRRSGMIRPMVFVLPERSAWAPASGSYPSSAIACCTRACVSGEIDTLPFAWPFNT
jgi:hypothetical protein